MLIPPLSSAGFGVTGCCGLVYVDCGLDVVLPACELYLNSVFGTIGFTDGFL